LALLRLLARHEPLGNASIRQHFGLKDRVNLHKNYLSPALEEGLIERTVPGKPDVRNQQYRLTDKGRAVLRAFPRP
jgi:ATP-dependent DNA helicase RecG